MIFLWFSLYFVFYESIYKHLHPFQLPGPWVGHKSGRRISELHEDESPRQGGRVQKYVVCVFRSSQKWSTF